MSLSSLFQQPFSGQEDLKLLPVPLHQHIIEAKQFSELQQTLVPLPYNKPTKSFWTDSDPNANPLANEGSQGNLTSDADIVIIGAGITGVSVAYHLSKLLPDEINVNVVVVEAREFCSGATGRNGGHLLPNKFTGFKSNVKRYGTNEALRSLALEKHTKDSILDILNGTSSEKYVDLVNGGHLELYFSAMEEDEAKADFLAAKEAGADVDDVLFLSSDETADSYGPPFPSAHYEGYNLWPLKLVTHLFRLARDKLLYHNSTLKLHTHTPVTHISPLPTPDSSSSPVFPPRWLLQTPRGLIRTSFVIHATNGYAAHLLPFLGPSPSQAPLTTQNSIVPVRGQVIATRAGVLSETLTKVSYGANDGFEYWFPRPVSHMGPVQNLSYHEAQRNEAPLIILGGGREVTGPTFELGVADDSTLNPTVSKILRDFLPAIYPEGWFPPGREPEMEWTGIMGFTESRNPLVGPVVSSITNSSLKGQYIAAGYSGHGMPRAFGCAEALVQLLTTDMLNKSWDIPEWFPRHFLTAVN